MALAGEVLQKVDSAHSSQISAYRRNQGDLPANHKVE
jgi:hypothetical protein